MKAPLGFAALLFALLACGWVSAQPRLVIDGLDIPGNTTSLVSGRSYAPARALALALGAELGIDAARSRATLHLGGRIVSVALFTDPGAAATAENALGIDGRTAAGAGGLLVGGELFLPVQPVIAAFGGEIAFLPEDGAVVATLPRARLERATIERGDGERLRIELSAPVGYSVYLNEPVATLQLRIDRTSLARAETLSGTLIDRADLIPGAGYVDVRVSVPAGRDYRVYTVPGVGGAFDLFIDFGTARPVATPRAAAAIVLDPGHGGTDPGAEFAGYGHEGDLTLDFVALLGAELEALGYRVVTTRDAAAAPPLEARLSYGVGAELFVSIHAADLPPGSYNLYYLDDAGDAAALDLALRSNAEEALAAGVTDEVRRKLLLGLITNLELGRRFAGALERELLQLGGYQMADGGGAPLFVLTGAAGRGLLLEFGPDDLRRPQLAPQLAAALATVLGSGGFD